MCVCVIHASHIFKFEVGNHSIAFLVAKGSFPPPSLLGLPKISGVGVCLLLIFSFDGRLETKNTLTKDDCRMQIDWQSPVF